MIFDYDKKKIEKILDKIKKESRPSKFKDKIIDEKLKIINNLLKKNKIKAYASLGGSFAKKTFLKNDYDVDIFVKFDMQYEKKKISQILYNAIKSLNPEKLHGSRDYFKINNKIEYEIIPVLDIKNNSDARNITDMSPLHVDWVNKNIKPFQRDEIRLTKLFCKANRTYGAESFISGFSGHVIDILIIYYGSFLKLLEASLNWKEKEIIDFYNYHKGNSIKNLNYSKIQSPLILIDPISPDRNASASLCKEKIIQFKESARKFLENPSTKFFVYEKMTIPKLKKLYKDKKLIIFNIELSKDKYDIIGSKIVQTYNYILNKFTNNTFNVLDSGWEWDKNKKAFLWYVCSYEMLEKEFLRVGPPLNQTYHVNLFKKKHKKTIEKENRIFAKVIRKYRKVERLAKDVYLNLISNRIKKINMKYYKI
jgi:tRNA nucleotidyltransferase (CCA-adding enzyme)